MKSGEFPRAPLEYQGRFTDESAIFGLYGASLVGLGFKSLRPHISAANNVVSSGNRMREI